MTASRAGAPLGLCCLTLLLGLAVGPSDLSASAKSDAASAAKGASAAASSASEPELKTLEFFVEGFRLREKYMSMEGPMHRLPIKKALAGDGPTVWVRSLKVEILDQEDETLSSEFLCHAWLSFKSPKASGMMTVSQGTESVTLPEGFAFTMPNDPKTKVMLIGMLENNNYDEIDQQMTIKYTIGYYSDSHARKLELRKLEPISMVGRPDAPAFHPKMHMMPGMNPHHWMVPPGRHTYRSALVRPLFQTPGNPLGIRKGTRIHFMRPHLHGYGESVALNDKTTGKTVWKGRAENAKGLRKIIRADFYSDVEGMPLYSDHEYELEMVYDNPTDEPIDGMGALRAFVSVE